MRPAAVVAVLAAVVVAIGFFGVRVATAQEAARPVPVMATPALTRVATPTSSAVALVHVVGYVETAGVVTVPATARVLDAIRAAGGARAGAGVDQVNLARPVMDGERLVVPAPGESVAPTTSLVGSPGAKVNLNSADRSALEGLPGVGPVLAERIIAWRTEHGRFTTVEELAEVPGIGERLRAQLLPKVTV